MDNIYNTLDENKKQKYIKIVIITFIIFVIILITYFFSSRKDVVSPVPSEKDKTGFLDIIGIEENQNPPKENTPFKDGEVDPEDPDFGLWSFYNVFSDDNVILYSSIDKGVVFLKRDSIEIKKDKDKYSLYFSDLISTQYIKIDYNDTARSWSVSKDFDYIFINGDKKSILYSITPSQNTDSPYITENIGEIENVISSTIISDNIFFIKKEKSKTTLYKIDLKTLKEQKLLDIPIKNIDLYNVKNVVYIKTKPYNGEKQLILKYNIQNNKFEPYSYSYLEEKNFDNVKLINNNDNNIVLNYDIDKKIDINIKTTLNKCNAGDGYVFCGYSDNYNNLNSWLKKENFVKDKIFIQDLETKKIYTIDILEDIMRNIDIDNISISNNHLYFTDRNTGAFIGLNLEILEYLELNN